MNENQIKKYNKSCYLQGGENGDKISNCPQWNHEKDGINTNCFCKLFPNIPKFGSMSLTVCNVVYGNNYIGTV